MDRYRRRRRDGFRSDTRDFISESVKGDHFREFLSDKTKLTQEQIRELIARSKDFNGTERMKVKSDGGTQFVLLPAGTVYSRDSRSTIVGWSTSLSEALNLSIGYRKENEPLGSYEDEVFQHSYRHEKGYTHYLVSKIQIFVDPKDGKVYNLKEAIPACFSDKILSITRLHTRLAWYNKENVRCYYNMLITFDFSIVNNAIEHEKKEHPNTMEQALSNSLTVGKISCSDKLICEGDMGTVIVEGVYQQRADIVCIKKGQNHDDDVVKKEVSDLCNANHNFVKVYGVESNSFFIFAAMEHCGTSLRKFIRSFHNQRLKDCSELLNLIREIVSAISWLHCKRIYGNLNLDSIFVDNHSKPKISLISPSKNATDDMLRVDMLTVGRIIFFCLTGQEYNRQNLTKLQPSSLYLNCPDALDALDLLRKLDNNNSTQRTITALQASNHTLFWSPSKKLQFIRAVTERLELRGSTLRGIIENIKSAVFGGSWENKLPKKFIQVMEGKNDERGNKQFYNKSKVYDLLRIIRNLMSHLMSNKTEINKVPKDKELFEMFGKAKEVGLAELGSYIQRQIPNLVNEVYNVMRNHLEGEANFLEYYKQMPL